MLRPMDPKRHLVVAKLARDRAALYSVPALTDYKDGMERKGAKAPLDQFAQDLGVWAGCCS
jgi:hypothetical protein